LLPSARELAAVAAGFVIATILLTLPLAAHPTRTLPSDLVDTLLNTWILGWDAERLRHGLAGVWNAPIYFPYHDTLAFSENLFGIAVLVAPVYWLSGNPVLTYNVAFVLSFVLAGVGMYLLVRTLTASRIAAIAAGLYYAFCPFRMAQISHVQMVATGWLPIALWALTGYFATRRRLWLSVVAAAAILQATSNSYVAYYMAVPILAVAAAGLWRAGRGRLRAAAELAVAGLVALAILAPVGAAYYRVKHDYGQTRSAAEIADGGADLRAYLVAKTTIGTGRWLPTAVVTDPEKELFPGFVVIALAGVACAEILRRRSSYRSPVLLYAGIAVAGLLCSLGPFVRLWSHLVTLHGPYDWLLHVVPGMDGMRVPARFAIVFVLGLSVVAGCGVAILLERMRGRGRALLAAAIAVGLISDGWAVPIPTERYVGAGRPDDRAVAAWLKDRPAGAVLNLPILTFNFQELNYQYATLIHGHPLVNGFSGYNTPLQEFLRNPRSPLYDWDRFPALVAGLRHLGVRYVVVHVDDYNLTQSEAHEPDLTMAGLRRSGQVVAEQRFLNTYAFELQAPPPPPASPPLAEVARNAMRIDVSDDRGRGRLMTDGDRDTRWIGRQEGGSWIEVRLDRPTDVGAIGMQVARRSIEEYPRELQIDATDPDGHSRTLYRGTPYGEFLRGVVRNGDYPTIEIPLPPNQTSVLTVREVGVYPDRWWSVHELHVWRR
jgi:hypothetical protein